MQTTSFVKIEIAEQIAVITINNPPVNALSAEVFEELELIINEIEKSQDIRVAIVTGAGEKAFVAGADIKQFLDLDYTSGIVLVKSGQEVFRKISKMKFPVICAVNGYAFGGGCELALACDIRIASENAQFGLPETGLGIIPGYGGTQRLARLVGIGKAKELILTGRTITAREAEKIGLVQKTVQREQIMHEAKDMANLIIKKGPIATEKAKTAIDSGIQVSLAEGLELEVELFGQLCETEDKNEGARSFLDKRKPVFTGK
ncbi:enoyl-CoA hydratase/isomerase family protein [Peribacillus frigoritolerans]|uniref:enoyl-CoA hydratase/isomerase family protein n=1 Tax=Peribacillus frigoritolerans TaxID=450367 RepID=UPI003871C0CB